MVQTSIAQIDLKLSLQPDGITYTAFARSESDFLAPTANITHAAKLVVTVPAGAFALESLTNHNGQWQLTNLVQHPQENPTVDYVLFELVAPTDAISYPAAQEIPLFSFKNSRGCAGKLDIMHPAEDPFLPPNSLNLAVQNAFYVEGAGPGNAISGRYDVGAANCFNLANCAAFYELELLPDNYYQVSLRTSANFSVSEPLTHVQVALRVPTNFFQIHGLANLLPGQFTFGNIARYDSPAEDNGHDYIQFRLNATTTGVQLQAGNSLPIFRFANGGSCQGDSIYLVKNDDPFLPPNSQSANIGQVVRFGTNSANLPICPGQHAAAACVGCLFTNGLVSLDSVQAAHPVACLGGMNGMLKLFGHGSQNLEYSIDGGQNWSANAYFTGLGMGSYWPQVRGVKFGCSVVAIGAGIQLQPDTTIELKLEAPVEACEGSDVQFKIVSPNSLPANSTYQWSGPQGFAADYADPVIFGLNNFQSGTYTLTVAAPGCQVATTQLNLQVRPNPSVPDLLSNGPVCFGEKLKLFTTAPAANFDWYGPVLGGLPTLSTTDSVVFIDPTMDAYGSGNWQLKVANEWGCSAMSAPLATLIKPRPQAFAETGGPICPGGTAQLFSNPLPGATYEWRREGESNLFSTQPNPLISNVLASQSFTLLVWQDGCVSSIPAVATVALNPLPSLDPQHQYTPSIDCSPKPLNLLANASGTGLSYNWAGPNGFSSQAANPVIAQANAAANGSYTLLVTNVFGCTKTESVVVAGIPNPVLQPQIASSGNPCPGGDLMLTIPAFTGLQVSYQWFKGTTPITGQTSSSLIINGVQPGAEGNYKIRATVDGCVVESSNYLVDVLDRPQPNADFYLSQPCEGGTLQFLSNQNGIAAWQWTGPGGFSSNAVNPVIYNVQLQAVGAYELTVTGTNGCTANESLIIDGILAVPDAPLVASNSPVCPGSDYILTVQNPSLQGAVYFEWQNANGEAVGTGEAVLNLSVNDPLAVPPFLVKTIVNTCPSALSDPVNLTVLPAPVALAWHGGAVCEGGNVELFAAAQPNVGYEWSSGGQVVSLVQNPTLTVTDSTEFQLVVKTVGCDAQATASVLVPVNPIPKINDLTGNLFACEGSPVNLSATNPVAYNAPLQYTWTGPIGFNYTGSAPAAGPFSLSFAAIGLQNEGSYMLMLTSSEGCQSAPESVLLEVGQVPASPVLTVTDAQICEGETLQLDATPAIGANVSYDWFFNDQWIATTPGPTYFAVDASLALSGNYHVKTTADGCASAPSNLAPVSVTALPAGALASNPTSAIAPACEGTDVPLTATFLPGASYYWYGPLGFFSNLPNPVVTDVSTSNAGDYLVVIGYPQCSATLAFETPVFVADTPDVPILEGSNMVCEGSDAIISLANPSATATYDFYFGQNGQPFQLGGNEVVLPSINTSQSGSYYALATLNGCESALSAAFNLQVLPAQTGTAFAGNDQTICEANEVAALYASPPTVGAGFWTALDGATVVQPTAANSAVFGLVPGENRFVWTLTNGICPGKGNDTTVVLLEGVKVMEDYYSLPLNDSLLNINLLENDFIQNLPEWDFTVLTTPSKGSLMESADGTVSYFPYPNAFGEDGFRYRICSMACPDVCDEAVVRLALDGSVAAEDCFRPNLITPNGDGLDDAFVIPCAVGWPGSSLLVFNRWGATVFEAKDYKNDWEGTYNGQPLPPGTYFYQLRLNDGKGTVLQGYVAVE